ncbi:MAG: hypothetical protein H0W88_07270 [Parachlamydiaceae bacterium]|nr:hypothetical protein [Parachlamydiaceae bacterium]
MMDKKFYKIFTVAGVLTLAFFALQTYGTKLDAADAPVAPNGKKTLEITIEKDNSGNYITKIVDAKGNKDPMNLGNLISKAAVLTPASSEEVDQQVKINSGRDFTPVKIMLEKGVNGELTTILIGSAGKREKLNFGNLLTELSHSISKSDITFKKGQVENTRIEVLQENNGEFQAYIIDEEGKKDELNLGTLLRALGLELTGTKEKIK